MYLIVYNDWPYMHSFLCDNDNIRIKIKVKNLECDKNGYWQHKSIAFYC